MVMRLATLTSMPVLGARRYVFGIITAQVLVQIGAFAFPALLPDYIERWSISKTEAGWLVGISFLAYIAMVPILLSLTDRIPVRRVLSIRGRFDSDLSSGFRADCRRVLDSFPPSYFSRRGWAGTFMPGLKALTDPFEGSVQSRVVSWHAAGIGISGAASFGIAGIVGNSCGASVAFLVGATMAFGAFLLASAVMHPTWRKLLKHSRRRLLDFRPVLRNRAAMVGSSRTRRIPGNWQHCALGE